MIKYINIIPSLIISNQQNMVLWIIFSQQLNQYHAFMWHPTIPRKTSSNSHSIDI